MYQAKNTHRFKKSLETLLSGRLDFWRRSRTLKLSWNNSNSINGFFRHQKHQSLELRSDPGIYFSGSNIFNSLMERLPNILSTFFSWELIIIMENERNKRCNICNWWRDWEEMYIYRVPSVCSMSHLLSNTANKPWSEWGFFFYFCKWENWSLRSWEASGGRAATWKSRS